MPDISTRLGLELPLGNETFTREKYRGVLEKIDQEAALAADLTQHAAGSGHVSSSEKAAWNGKADASLVVQAVLTPSGWVGASPPYTQNVTAAGVAAGGNGFAALAQGASATAREAARDACLSVTGQGNGNITITADGDKPAVDIPITVVVIG